MTSLLTATLSVEKRKIWSTFEQWVIVSSSSQTALQVNQALQLFNGRSGVTIWLLSPCPVLTSPLLESLDSPKTSRNFCRLLPITEETCSAASNPGPSPAALGWAPETLHREAVTLIRPALLPVPELLLPPGRAGNRHRQLCAILHSVCLWLPCDQRYLGGRNPNPALHINNLYHSASLSQADTSLCMLRGGTEETPTMHFLSGPIQALHGWIQIRFRGFARELSLALES